MKRFRMAVVPLVVFVAVGMVPAVAHAVGGPPAVSITSVTGTFYPKLDANSGTFDVRPHTPPVFTQRFAGLIFNYDAQFSGPLCSNDPGTGAGTSPFTEVIPVSDGSCQYVVAQGNGVQAFGTGLDSFNATFIGAMRVSGAGDVTFDGVSDDGFDMGFGRDKSGDQPTYVSGPLNNAPARTFKHDDALVVSDFSLPSGHALNDAQFTVHFPAAGSYPYEVDYAECCDGGASFVLTANGSSGGLFHGATVTLSTHSATPGGLVNFTGKGYLPNEVVNVYEDSPNGTLVGSATASSSGRVVGAFNVTPLAIAGIHPYFFIGQTSHVSASDAVSVS